MFHFVNGCEFDEPRMVDFSAAKLPDVSVRWSPRGGVGLDYQALYRGLYEFLREPPERSRVSQATRYLRKLEMCYHPSNHLQRDRIRWTRMWLDAVEDPLDSDDETVKGSDD